MSRRSLLASLGVVGVGLAAAGGRAMAAPFTPADPGTTDPLGLATSGSPLPSPSPGTMLPPSSSLAVPTPAPTSPTPSAIASATASATATTSPTDTPTPSPTDSTPTPVATRDRPTQTPTPTSSPSASSAAPVIRSGGSAFVSGSSCIGASNGQFGSWRGKKIQVASTWGADGQTYVVDPGAEYGSWGGSLDYAPQYKLDGAFTWAAMANGQFDSRIRGDLQQLKSRWAGKQGTLYYRFQHEFNGDWYQWAVDEGNASQMVAGWRRMAGIFRGVFGNDRRFQITWSPNAGSAPKKFSDIRKAWPGAQYVDVIGIDFYDFFKPQNAGDWNGMSMSKDSGGGPIGIGAWQQFAEQQGVAWAVPEWGNQFGDNPYYIQRMHDFFADHAYTGSGSQAGKLVYEVYFNQLFDGGNTSSGGDFRVMVNGADSGARPNAARTYRQLFGA